MMPGAAAWPWALTVLLAGPAAQQPLADALRRDAEQYRTEQGIPGLAVAVLQGGEVVLAEGFGTADLENDVAVHAGTVFRLGSISKPWTAVLALQLVAQGHLDLDADVRTYLPEFPEKQWPVTTRQLLGHLGGVRHYKPGEGESTVRYATQRQALARFAADPLLHEPGTRYLYSTFGYNLAAAVVEAVGGRPFPELLRQGIAVTAAAPSLQDDDVHRLIRHRAQGYRRVRGELQNSVLMDGSYKLGGGGLCSDVADLVRCGDALLDGRLLPREMLQRMTTSQRTRDGAATGYGLGLSVGERRGRAEWWHGGAQSRVSTVLLLCPEPRAAVAVLCNLEGVRPLALARQLLDRTLDAGK